MTETKSFALELSTDYQPGPTPIVAALSTPHIQIDRTMVF